MYLPGTVNDRIGDLRTSKGLSQKELSEITGIAPSQINRIENGKIKNISSEILVKLAKAFKVSTDYILGLTTVSVPKSYDISELGLSEDAVKNLLALKDNMPVLNKLLAHRSFPALIKQIRTYFHDELALGVMGRNAFFDMATMMLDDYRKEHPENNAAVRENIRFVNAEKLGKHEIDIEKIKNTFLAILRDIKKEIDEDKTQNDTATAEFMQKVWEEILSLPPESRTPGDAVNMLIRAVETVAPIDSENKESCRQLVASMLKNFGADNTEDEVPAGENKKDE